MVLKERLETQNFAEESLNYNELLYHYKKIKKQLYGYFSLMGEQRCYTSKNMIFQIEDNAHEAYYVESGRVKIYQLTPEGKEVTFQILKPGDGLGIAEVFLNCRRTRYAEAMCKTNLWVINREQLFNLMLSNKEFYLNLLWALHQEVLKFQDIVEDLTVLPVRDRLMKLLIRLCKERGTQMKDHAIIDFPLTHEELAKMVGCNRKTVTIVLNELREQGFLSWEKKKIKVFSLDELNENVY